MAVDITNEEAITELNVFKIGAMSERGKAALDMAIALLEQKPCEDCVSREQAKTEIRKAFPSLADRVYINSILNELPPVTPQPKTGRWIYDYTTADGHRTYHCSECGCYLKPKHSEPLNSFKWCSLCGAKMESER